MSNMHKTRQECMIGVHWTGLNDPGDDGRGHNVFRDMSHADLGLDGVPDPPFTREEIQRILFAAKMEALKCLQARRKRKRATKKPKLCGIPASGGMIGHAECDMPWGHPGDMHANGGDGFYAYNFDEEHRRRQKERGAKVPP